MRKNIILLILITFYCLFSNELITNSFVGSVNTSNDIEISKKYNVISSYLGQSLQGEFYNSEISIKSGFAYLNSNVVDDNVSSLNESNNPLTFELLQNYPNPFNPSTTISFKIPKKEKVRLIIYNTNGKMVEELANSNFEKGKHSLNFNANKLSSGQYFYRIEAGKNVSIKKMLFIK